MKSIAELILKLVALYLMLSNLGHLIQTLAVPGSWIDEREIPMLGLVAWLGFPILIGLILWFSSSSLAERITKVDGESIEISEQGLVSAGVFLIGLYWVIKSIAIVLGQFLSAGELNYGYIIVFCLACYFVVGNKAVTRAYVKFRNA